MVIINYEVRIFQRAGAKAEKAGLLLPTADIPWLIEPEACPTCLIKLDRYKELGEDLGNLAPSYEGR